MPVGTQSFGFVLELFARQHHRAYEGGQYWLGWTRNGTVLAEADLTEDEKANTIGLCTLYRFELGSPETSFFRSPGDMSFFPWYNNTGLLGMFRCVEFWPCYCKPKAMPAAPPPAAEGDATE